MTFLISVILNSILYRKMITMQLLQLN